MGRKSLILFSFLFFSASWGQKVVKGVVRAASDNSPLPGVTVLVKGTSTGTTTDFDGNYKITAPSEKSILVFSLLGMSTQEKVVGKHTTINVSLKEDVQQIAEVVVTGITSTDKRLFTGAADRIVAEEVKLAGVSDVSRSLEGRSAGVSVQNVSGTFGAAPKIRVRGATSILGSSKPLWVLDGVVVEDVVDVSADDLASGDPNTLISSAIAGLNPEDIESFQVLKDGSATSIYGAKAMAGVIVVTTKKGKTGVSSFNYTAEFTNRLIPRYADFNIMNSQEQMSVYQEMERAGWLNFAVLTSASSSGIYGKMYRDFYKLDKQGNFVFPNTSENIKKYLEQAERRNTNWFNQLFQQSIMQTHSVSMSSGTEKSSYYASLSFLDDPGWSRASSVNRYTANLNASYKITDDLKLNLISTGAYRKQKAPGSLSQEVDIVTGEVRRDFDINPYSYALNTSRVLDPKAYYVKNYAPFNIFHELENNYIDINVTNVKFQGELDWNIIKGLNARVLGAISYSGAKMEHNVTELSNQAMAYRVIEPNTIREKNPFLYKDPDVRYSLKEIVLPEGGLYKQTFNELLSYSFRGLVQYRTTIKDTHIFESLAGTEANASNRRQTWTQGYGLQYKSGEVPFFDYKIFKFLKERGDDYYGLTSNFYRDLSFFGNLTYSYRSKYILNGTIRYEGSNQLGKTTRARWLPTWNVAASWNVDQEKFFDKLQPAFSALTLKASYSLTADRGPASNSLAIIRSTTQWRGNADQQEVALYLKDLENSELTYEKKHELNLGANLGFLNNRVEIAFDWYKRNNYDLIGPLVTQGIGGFIVKQGNVASMESSGVDFSLSAVPVKTKDFSWKLNFVYAKMKNTVTDLKDYKTAFDFVTNTGFTKVGYPVRSLFSFPFEGLNIEGLPTFTNQDGKVTVSDINFQEREKLGFLRYSGSIDPTDVGSFGNVFSYKGLKLGVFATYSFGNVIRLDPVFSSQYSELDATPREFKNRWVMGGDENITNIPVIATRRQVYNTNPGLNRAYNTYNYSDVRVAKGDFIRLKEVSLTYDFDADLVKRMKLRKLAMSLQATNLFLLYSDKKLNGQDPEFFNSGGVAIPMPKQYTFTLRVGL